MKALYNIPTKMAYLLWRVKIAEWLANHLITAMVNYYSIALYTMLMIVLPKPIKHMPYEKSYSTLLHITFRMYRSTSR